MPSDDGDFAAALFSAWTSISLDAMNERAALQRRTDNKYVVAVDPLSSLIEDLADRHEVLDIDDERAFDYESTYFDTPELRCFHDHVGDRRPRYKARTRCYVTTGDCFFEVKVKREDGETVKRHVAYDPDQRETVTAAARELLGDTLGDCGLDAPDELRPSLVTAFRRVTVVARERPERTTFDFDVRLRSPSDYSAQLEREDVIAETKTADGDGAWDRAFAERGFEPASVSKYRMGTGLLNARGEDEGYASEIKNLFRIRRESVRERHASSDR